MGGVQETCSKTVLIFVIAFGYVVGTFMNDDVCISASKMTFAKHLVDVLS